MAATSRVTGDGLVWRDPATERALTSERLAAFAPHAFTTRAFDFEAEADASAAIARLFDVPARAVCRVRQVHGADVMRIAPHRQVPDMSVGDAVVCTDPSRVVAVAVADCVPVLIADRDHRVVAAVHAGWRGTAAGIVSAAIAAIRSEGIAPERLVAAIGPSIGPCCYQVDEPVRDALVPRHSLAARWLTPDGERRWKLDLWDANRSALIEAGVPADAIHLARLCTFDHPAMCHSYRRDGPRAGRMFAAIRLGAPGR